MEAFALPCHPERRLDPEDRQWRSIGVKSADDVRRQQTRCPDCKTTYTAFLRGFSGGATVEWLRPSPFHVTAAAVDGAPLWQDATAGASTASPLQEDRGVRELQQQVASLGAAWERSVQVCTPVYPLMSAGAVVAEPGDLLLERREKWNAHDRRLALLWSPRVQQQVVAWHGFARLLQPESAAS